MPVGISGARLIELGVGSLGAIGSSNAIPINPGQAYGEDSGNVPIGVSSLGRTCVGPAAHEVTLASALTLPTGATGQFWNSATGIPLGRTKAIYVLVTTALVFAAGQPTMRLYGSRTAVSAGNGSTTALGLAQTYLSAALTITTAAQTTIPVNTVYRITSSFGSVSVGAAAQVVLGATTGWSELDRWDQFIGVEFNWGGSFTSGALSLFIDCAGT